MKRKSSDASSSVPKRTSKRYDELFRELQSLQQQVKQLESDARDSDSDIDELSCLASPTIISAARSRSTNDDYVIDTNAASLSHTDKSVILSTIDKEHCLVVSSIASVATQTSDNEKVLNTGHKARSAPSMVSNGFPIMTCARAISVPMSSIGRVSEAEIIEQTSPVIFSLRENYQVLPEMVTSFERPPVLCLEDSFMQSATHAGKHLSLAQYKARTISSAETQTTFAANLPRMATMRDTAVSPVNLNEDQATTDLRRANRKVWELQLRLDQVYELNTNLCRAMVEMANNNSSLQGRLDKALEEVQRCRQITSSVGLTSLAATMATAMPAIATPMYPIMYPWYNQQQSMAISPATALPIVICSAQSQPLIGGTTWSFSGGSHRVLGTPTQDERRPVSGSWCVSTSLTSSSSSSVTQGATDRSSLPRSKGSRK
jgi:predicted  nucleic acid-binding Zn-ribbon protein